MKVEFRQAATPEDFDKARELFKEYAQSLAIDLAFQDFATELENISTHYSAPTGAVIVAFINGHPAGCVAVRPFSDGIAELKRMFVRPEYRSQKLGRVLLQKILDVSKQFHYKKIRLDTLSDMSNAQNLYKSFGFHVIPPYRFNPVVGAVYMEKDF